MVLTLNLEAEGEKQISKYIQGKWRWSFWNLKIQVLILICDFPPVEPLISFNCISSLL